MNRYNLVSFAGIFVLVFIAWVFSANHRKFNLRCVFWGIVLQLVFAALIFLWPTGSLILAAMGEIVLTMINASWAGIEFCFGPLATDHRFILAIHGLPMIVFFAAVMGVLYYLGIMQRVIKLFARLFTRLMNISGAESLCTAANIFVGIESATMVRPYLNRMTRSELCTILTAGFATIATTVLAYYTSILLGTFPTIAAHLMSASVLSAPAALVMSKLLLPETDTPETLGRVVEPEYERESSIIESAINGASAGGKMVFGIIVMLLAFLGMVALINIGLDNVSVLIGKATGSAPPAMRLENLLAYVFYPFALIMGVPLADAMPVAKLMGMRTIMTEIPAYMELNRMIASGVFQDGRSPILASYALCGFSHVASVAIFVGGISALVPKQTKTLVQVSFRALVAATLACFMTAAVAGTFYGNGLMILNLPAAAAAVIK